MSAIISLRELKFSNGLPFSPPVLVERDIVIPFIREINPKPFELNQKFTYDFVIENKMKHINEEIDVYKDKSLTIGENTLPDRDGNIRAQYFVVEFTIDNNNKRYINCVTEEHAYDVINGIKEHIELFYRNYKDFVKQI